MRSKEGRRRSGLKQDEHQQHVGLGEATPQRGCGGHPSTGLVSRPHREQVTSGAGGHTSSLMHRAGTAMSGVLLGYRVFWGRGPGTDPAWVTRDPFAPGGGPGAVTSYLEI